MIQSIEGLAYVVGDDVDTDQIVPGDHLVYSMRDEEGRKQYGRYALSGLPNPPAPFVAPDAWTSTFSVVVAGDNFGCGSSREQAPFALEMAGAKAVIAKSFARIFYRNAVDGGFFLPFEFAADPEDAFELGDPVAIDPKEGVAVNRRNERVIPLKPLGEAEAIVRAGGIFAFARETGLI